MQQQSSDKLQLALEPLDTKKPMDISEEEELERISALLQRDNLVRGLGIVEHVYRSVPYSATCGRHQVLMLMKCELY